MKVSSARSISANILTSCLNLLWNRSSIPAQKKKRTRETGPDDYRVQNANDGSKNKTSRENCPDRRETDKPSFLFSEPDPKGFRRRNRGDRIGGNSEDRRSGSDSDPDRRCVTANGQQPDHLPHQANRPHAPRHPDHRRYLER